MPSAPLPRDRKGSGARRQCVRLLLYFTCRPSSSPRRRPLLRPLGRGEAGVGVGGVDTSLGARRALCRTTLETCLRGGAFASGTDVPQFLSSRDLGSWVYCPCLREATPPPENTNKTYFSASQVNGSNRCHVSESSTGRLSYRSKRPPSIIVYQIGVLLLNTPTLRASGPCP